MPNIVHNTSNGPLHFGPVFDKDFLTDVYHLQEEIKALGKDSNGSLLQNICYAPLRTEYSREEEDVSNCVVQSIWGYFQDDLERLDEHEEDNGFDVSMTKRRQLN